MRYKNVFFDLDGTITEPSIGITNGIINALVKLGLEVPERSALFPFIGPPLRDSFRDFYGMDPETIEKAVGYYREYYSVQGILENDVMPGIEQALKNLRDAGCRMFVATSKPEPYAIKILEHLNLDSYFDIIAGSTLDGSRDKKELVIEYLLDQLGDDREKTVSETVMIGDRMFDVVGAKAFDMDSIGVTFGYGSREELEEYKATYIVDKAEEFVSIILKGE